MLLFTEKKKVTYYVIGMGWGSVVVPQIFYFSKDTSDSLGPERCEIGPP